MESQHHLKILCDNGIDKFAIVERWVRHSDLGGGGDLSFRIIYLETVNDGHIEKRKTHK